MVALAWVARSTTSPRGGVAARLVRALASAMLLLALVVAAPRAEAQDATPEPTSEPTQRAESADAFVVEPLAASAWSAGFGMLTDRFGVTWSVSVTA